MSAPEVEELRRIGLWLNRKFPADLDSDGDRVLAAADEIDRLRAAVSVESPQPANGEQT